MKKLGTLVLYEAGLALAKPSLCQPGPFLLGRLEAEGKFPAWTIADNAMGKQYWTKAKMSRI